MMHKCNICEKEMTEIDDIDLKGFKIRGWRCGCGNTHSNSEDVDVIVRFFRYMKKHHELSLFKTGNSLAVRIPKPIADLYHLNPSSKVVIEAKTKEIRLKILK